MGMWYSVIVGGQIVIKNAYDDLIHELRENFEDEAVFHTNKEGMPKSNIVITSNGNNLFHGAKYDEAEYVEVSHNIMQKEDGKFIKEMRSIIQYLEDKDIEHSITFGIISSYD